MSNPTSPLPRFQFSLRWLLIAVTVAAVLLGLAVDDPIQFFRWALFIVIWCAIPTPLIVGAIFGRGELRLFCLGAAVPWVALWGENVLSRETMGSFIGTILALLATSGICGWIAVRTGRWIERSGGTGNYPS